MVKNSLLRYAGEAKKYIFSSVFVMWLRLFLNIGFSFVLSFILYNTINGEFTKQLMSAVLIIMVLLILRQLTVRRNAVYKNKVIAAVKTSLREQVMAKVLGLGTAYQEKLSTGEVIHMGMDTIEQLENYYGNYITQFYYCLVTGVTLFVVLVPLAWPVGLLLMLLSPIIPFGLRLLMKMVAKMQKKYWKKFNNVGELFLDSLQGLSTLKIFRADQRRAEEIEGASEDFRKETMRILKMQLTSMILIDFFAYGATASGIILGLSLYRSGSISLYAMILVLFLAAEFFIPMRALTATFHVAMTGMSAADQMVEFLEEPLPEKTGTNSLPEEFSIEVRDLDFRYRGNDSFRLDGINLMAEHGGLLAIVGPSGCGKSTLAALLSGQITPPEDKIFLGGLGYHSISPDERVRQVTRVTHNGHIFSGTVESNLKMARPEATDEEMWAVLRQVSLEEHFRLKDGLDTKTDSEGKNLSGGQAQRLSLARALLHDSRAYIFDEATSNIDVESEAIILDVIRRIASEKTVIVISHRLQSIQTADQILVMEGGRIEESGTHDRLMAQDGLYKKLYNEQKELEDFAERKGRVHV